eukprot:6557739-Pyramimonas_sp.AAC.1
MGRRLQPVDPVHHGPQRGQTPWVGLSQPTARAGNPRRPWGSSAVWGGVPHTQEVAQEPRPRPTTAAKPSPSQGGPSVRSRPVGIPRPRGQPRLTLPA